MPTNATLIKSSAPTCHVHPRASVVWCHWCRRQTRFDPPVQIWPNLTRWSWPGLNYHKKRASTMVDFDQKVKIFKADLSHSVFQIHSDFGICFFIRNSEIAQTSDFQKNWLLHKSWPKVKIFKTNLSHLVFRVHYNFGIRFFIQNSEIAQTSNFQKSWFFHKFWQKVKNFKKDLSCPIFRVDSNFGVYFFIWESKISQIVWFYIYWLWCELWACPIQIFAKILILKSTYLFWTWKPPIWPTSLKYWQCPKLRLPKSKFEIHPFSLDSLKVILQTASRLSF